MPRATAVDAKGQQAREKRRELERAQRDLYYLGVKLGYAWTPAAQQGMTEELHKPLCKRMDTLRDHERVLTIAPRKSLKSTVLTICLAVQEILRDPDITILICHAVEAEAVGLVNEIGELFLHNEWLRSLDPVGVYPEGHKKAGQRYKIMPNPKNKRWLTEKGFRVTRAGVKQTTRREPTCRGKGAGSELTGKHCDLIFLDDIIGRNTIEDSQMPKIRTWYRQTTLNVLNTNGRVRCVGTRWDADDIYADFLKSKVWDSLVRAALEDPDTGLADKQNGLPIHYGPGTDKVPGGIKAAIAREKRWQQPDELGIDYDPQRMNDPSPAGEKPWHPETCENTITLKEAGGQGVIFVLSDPAPAKVGSFTGEMEKVRKDGTKDDWAIAVVKVRIRNKRREAILMDGSFSQEWTKDAGFAETCRHAGKWGTPYIANEATGQAIALYEQDLRAAARKAGIPFSPVKLENTYKGNAKNVYFASLASMAKVDEFLICEESCDAEFLAKFLDQSRNWRPLTGGRNGLKYDDCANVVSFCTDPALLQYAPHPIIESPWDSDIETDEGFVPRSRYCAA